MRALRNPRRAALAALLACAAASWAHAHDFWIELPARARAGELVPVQLLVGEHLVGERVPRRAGRIVRFLASGPAGASEIPGVDENVPAGLWRPAQAGQHLIAYESLPAHIELDAEKFEAYLAEEGLDAIRELRAKAGASGKPARERYTRCAKALIEVGPEEQRADFDCSRRVLGLPLELVCVSDPRVPAARLELLLVRSGQPLAGATVLALSSADPKAALRARTDERGQVAFELPRGGRWLLKSVHMEPHPEASAADWQSFWASLVLDLPERGAPAGAGAASQPAQERAARLR